MLIYIQGLIFIVGGALLYLTQLNVEFFTS
jgi:hypothetical protein